MGHPASPLHQSHEGDSDGSASGRVSGVLVATIEFFETGLAFGTERGGITALPGQALLIEIPTPLFIDRECRKQKAAQNFGFSAVADHYIGGRFRLRDGRTNFVARILRLQRSRRPQNRQTILGLRSTVGRDGRSFPPSAQSQTPN